MSWKEHWKEIGALSRWEAAAALSSRKAWLARYWIPGAVVCAVAILVAAGGGAPRSMAGIRAAGARLGDALWATYYGMAVIGLPLLVWSAFDSARRSGMLDLLLAAPIRRRSILLAVLGGRLWAGAHFLVAAAPAFVLAWVLQDRLMARALPAILAGGACAMCLASFLAARKLDGGAFAMRYLGLFLFTPAALPARLWIPCGTLLLWLYSSWRDTDVFKVAYGIMLPLQTLSLTHLSRGFDGSFVSGICGAILFSAAALFRAIRLFPGRDPVPTRQGPPRRTAPMRSFRLYKEVRKKSVARGVLDPALDIKGLDAELMYRLTGNALVYRFFLLREESLAWSPSLWLIISSLVGLVVLFGDMGTRETVLLLEFFLVPAGFIACHDAASILAASSSRASTDLLVSALRGREVVLAALLVSFCGCSFLCTSAVQLCSLAILGFGGFAAALIWTIGTIGLGTAIGLWFAPAPWGRGERTAAGFALFLCIYLGLRHLIGGARVPAHHMLLGGSMQILAFVLLTLFALRFRALLRAWG